MTFDLENALVLEEQLKENIDDAFSCMCGVCHTCGFDPKEMGEALAEIERLRARDKQMAEAIVVMADGAKKYALSSSAIMHAVFDEADSLVNYCEKLENMVIAKDTEIERLRAENAGLSEAVIDTQEERDLAHAEFRTYHKAWEEGAARIQELEEALVDARGKLFHQFGDAELDPPGEDDRRIVQEMLRAEGKIGSSDHSSDATKKVWQITDERKAALLRAYDIVSWIDRVDSDNKLHITAILGMIKEAEAVHV